MKTFILSLFILTFISAQQKSVFPSSKPDLKLTRKLQELVKEFKGEYGIYVRHLKTGKTVEINADSLFPTASMIKIPIMTGIFDKVEKGELKYDSLLVFRDSLVYPGEDIVGTLKDSGRITLSKVVMLMITTSDNTGSLWCQQMAGTGLRINEIMEENGFVVTRVNSRTPGREQMRSQYGWGVTTPREMAELVVKIREGKMISPWVSERMYRNLARIYWDGEALSEIPPYIHAASKQGAVDQSRSEVVLVNAPSGDYVFCIITKNQQDESWVYENEGYVLLRNVSRTLWKYFEPTSTWHSLPESMKYH
ncbi:MAG: class A beta-lactamase-related serine hydrolase [Bacteroidetes bacterium]|nr:class A beta-lactamase-related serine hydrolase [Bacteroidota bacterium]